MQFRCCGHIYIYLNLGLQDAGTPTRIAAAKPAEVCELVRQMMQVLHVQRDREWVASVATRLRTRLALLDGTVHV